MSLYSHANLIVVEVASPDANRGALSGVHFASDGTTVATNGSAFLAVEPVDRSKVHYPDLGMEANPGEDGFTLTPETVKQAISNLPKGKPEMEFCSLTLNDGRKAELSTTKAQQELRVTGKIIQDRFPNWKRVTAQAGSGAVQARICINRRELANLLKTVDTACGGREFNPVVFIEIREEGTPLLLRARNQRTGQRIIGLLAPVAVRGQWLEKTKWEVDVLGKPPKRVPKRVSQEGR